MSIDERIRSFKYFRRWRSSQGVSPVNAGLPWITFAGLDCLDKIDLHGKSIFEFGCGGSSLYFLKKGANLYSTEHNEMWIEEVRSKITPLQAQCWKVEHHAPEPTSNYHPDKIEDPCYFLSGDPNYVGMNFQKYAESILKFPDAFFDVVLVDGRARPGCIRASIPKLKPKGLMIVDNSDRDYYFSGVRSDLHVFKKIMEFPGYGPFILGPWKTTFFFK